MAVNCLKYSLEVYLVGRSVKYRPFTTNERSIVIAFINSMLVSRPSYMQHIGLCAGNAGKALNLQNDTSLGKMLQKIGRSLKVLFCTDDEKVQCDVLFANTDPRRYKGYNHYVTDEPENPVPPNEMWYYAPEKIILNDETGVLSHDYVNGKGILTFGEAVTRVEKWFKDCRTITNVEMPSTVETIGESAFQGCFKLAMNALPEEVKYIERRAFDSCPKITISVIPSTVVSIEEKIFSMDLSITEMTFRGTPESIDGEAFYGCPNLENIYVPWEAGEVENAPWGANDADIHYGIR